MSETFVLGTASSPKSREDYLISFEEKLLSSLQGVFTSIDRNFLMVYGLSALLSLFAWGSISEISFLGAKLAVNGSDLYILIPLFVSAIYILISYQLYRIAEIYRSLNSNSLEIISLNGNARPIYLLDMKFFEAGIAGLVLALARWQATRLLTSNPFRLPSFADLDQTPKWRCRIIVIWRVFRVARRVINWINSLVVRLTGIIALFLIPLIMMIYYLHDEFFGRSIFELGFPLLVFIVLILVTVMTAVFAMKLFVTYFVDLLDTFRKDLTGNAQELATAASRLLGSWIIRLMMDTGIIFHRLR